MIIVYILIGVSMGMLLANYAYSKRLIEKAKAPGEYGGSNTLFVKGQPLAVMFEKDYIYSGMVLHRGRGRMNTENNCPKCGSELVWYHNKEDGISRAVCAGKCTGWEVLKEIDRTKTQRGDKS